MGHPQDDSRRAFVFSTLVVANLCLILTNRSWSRTIVAMFSEPNPALWWVVGGAAAVLAMVLYVPSLRQLFHFEALQVMDLAFCLAAGIASILWSEILKVTRVEHQKARGF